MGDDLEAVEHLERWLSAAGITSGLIFRGVETGLG